MLVTFFGRGDLCDFDFNPFNDEQIISCSADLTIMVGFHCFHSFTVVGVPGGWSGREYL